MKVEFTVFEDAPGYWFAPHEIEAAAIALREEHRGDVYQTKISACRAALEKAVKDGATELHLHGMGATTSIKREAAEKGVKPFIYWPSITTKLAPFIRSRKA